MRVLIALGRNADAKKFVSSGEFKVAKAIRDRVKKLDNHNARLKKNDVVELDPDDADSTEKDGIPELLIRANTSPNTYNGMSYRMIVTYQKSVADGNYMEMPAMVQDGLYPVTEGIASVGGSRVYVTMNEDMNEFFIISTSAGNGDSHTYVGHMEYDTGNYKWKQEEVGYYTWDQEEELEEAAKNYPVEINWVPIGTPLEW